jgi:hypothetical protein
LPNRSRVAFAQAADEAGGKTAVRAAVVRRLKFGEVELNDVPMLVIPDSQARNEWTAARPEGANWSAGGNRISDFSLEHGREVRNRFCPTSEPG